MSTALAVAILPSTTMAMSIIYMMAICIMCMAIMLMNM